MARQGYDDLQLTRFAGEGWRATFFITGHEHSPLWYNRVRLGEDALAGGAEGGTRGAVASMTDGDATISALPPLRQYRGRVI